MHSDQLCDYTDACVVVPIIREGVKVYACINQKMFAEDDGLAVTGEYWIYLLHPQKGSVNFTMEKDFELEKWITRDAPSWVDNNIVIEIGEQIEAQKAKPGVIL